MTEEQRRERLEYLALRIAVASGVGYDMALAAVMSVADAGHTLAYLSDEDCDLLRGVRRADASDVAEGQQEEANEHDGTA